MKAGPEAALYAHYAARLRPPPEVVEIPEARGSAGEVRKREGAALIAAQGPEQRLLEWLDPKVISTFALWAVSGGLLFARYRPDWQGRPVMVLTVLAFAVLAFALVGVGLVLPTRHGSPGLVSAGGRPTP